MKEYKELVVECACPVDNTIERALMQLSNRQGSESIKFDINDNQIIIFLNSIDYELFKNDISAFLETNDYKCLSDVMNAISNIRSYGLKGKKRVYVGYNDERKTVNRKEKEKNRESYYYTRNNDFSDTNNEVPSQYVNQIVCSDSKSVLKQLPDNCIDLIFTSPPYNFGLDYNKNDDDHHWEKYFQLLFGIFDECVRVLKYGGRFIVNVQPLFSDYIPTHHIISNYLMNKKLIWKGEILWEKNNYNCKYTAWGSWKSPSNPYLKYTWEFVEVFCKGTLKKSGDSSKADISGDEFKKWVYGKWSIAPERRMKEFDHPAMFPEELATKVLKLFSYQDDIILDPFNGVGTTTLVASLNNRRYLGIDISEEYCKKAKERLDSYLF
jgi:DNA modification methylase